MPDGHSSNDSLPLNPSLLSLPPGYETTGDPVDGNPFEPSTVRHRLWHEATRLAEEQIARLKSEFLAWQRKLPPPSDMQASRAYFEVFKAERRRHLAAEFDVWAGRAVQIALTDADVASLDAWFVGYANACLETQAGQMVKHGLRKNLAESELNEIRNLLSERVLYWKAESRRCRAVREEQARSHQEASENTARSGFDQSPAGPATGSETRRTFPHRAQWLERQLAARKWTATDLARFHGPDLKTVRKVLDGHKVGPSVLEKLVLSLSTKGSVVRSDIPNE